MANRLPLTTNKELRRIEELPVGDYLDLSKSGIVSATSIQSEKFYGDLIGTATTATYLTAAENILAGIINPARLSGEYNINISGVANKLERAENILAGIINPARLSGEYNIDITGKIGISSNASSNTYYPTFVDGTGTKSLNINKSSLTFIPQTAKLGIGTILPEYNLDVRGDISVDNRIYAPSTIALGQTTGTLQDGVNGYIIGVNTTGLLIGDYVADVTLIPPGAAPIRISPNTRITSIGIGSIRIGTPYIGPAAVTRLLSFTRKNRVSPGATGDILVSSGSTLPVEWKTPGDILKPSITQANNDFDYNVIVTDKSTGAAELFVDSSELTYNPVNNTLKVNGGDVIAENYFGDGVNLVGIVTQITAGIGINIKGTQNPGKGVVTIDAYRPVGKTIFVAQTGDDNNTGLTENYPKRTIKSAAAIALYGDTIKVYPGVYQEENPITLAKTVSIQGTELRNIVITPKYPELDLFYVNNGCHITNASFIGPEMTNGSAIVSLQPLLGVSTDRYFDAARMIRMNLDYIANESVGFLTSGFSGFAGTHREQDAARLIDLNLNYIAAEAVGFLTTASPVGYGFSLTDITNCKEDVVSIFGAVSYDLKANSNRKSVGAALSYFNNTGALQYLTGVGVSAATIATLNYAVGIAKSVINNVGPSISYQSGIGSVPQIFNPSIITVPGGCVGVGTTIAQLVGIVTTAIGLGNTSLVPTGAAIRYGVNLESNTCATDVKRVWKCIIHDITRGGNSRSYAAGASYYDNNWNLIPQILKNPNEVEQTIETLKYSFNIARSVVNNCTWGGYPVGLGTTVTNARYDNVTGIVTITATNHGLLLNDPVKVVGLGFTCPSGIGTLTYPTGNLGYIFPVKAVVGINTFEVVVGQSTLPHTYVSGGTIQKYQNFGSAATQVKDLSMQVDSVTGFNNSINSCSDVISALYSCVGIVTTVIKKGSLSNITPRYPGNSGIGFTTVVGIASAIYYDNTDTANPQLQGFVKLEAPGLNVKLGDRIELRDLSFECASSGSGISTQRFPSGQYGYDFYVNKINSDSSFNVFVGMSTLPHTYVGGGFIVNRSVGVTTASYNNITGITTITAPGAYVKIGDVVKVRDLKFYCSSGAGTTTIYPTGKNGYDFRVKSVESFGNTFTIQVGTSTIPHNYDSGGVVFPTYSKGVGPITQGPYIRNCTNFIPKSIGMKVDGFSAEPGEADDIGVTGAMSVDSYTQYNQGGIGVSITNGGYAQLVSIFTICDDIAIYTGSGGQCDLTNSNSSFGNYGLYSSGVGDNTTKSIYRYTGTVANTVNYEDFSNDRLVISGLGANRPYDGQVLYFDKLYYGVDKIIVTNGGSGYSETNPPEVIIDFPTGPNGIKAEASVNIVNGKVVSVDIISNGNQYITAPNISFSNGPATAEAIMYPLYYNIESATEPVAGISTVVLTTTLNNTVSAGTTVYFSRLSLQIATTISFEWVGAGTNINTAKPALGGVAIADNEVVKEGGGQVIYTSTNQSGNFKIGDGVVINQLTGTISGRAYNQSVLSTVTPFIVALG